MRDEPSCDLLSAISACNRCERPAAEAEPWRWRVKQKGVLLISSGKTLENQAAAPGEAPFYIPATGGASRPRLTLKHNDTFAVFDSHGDIGATAGTPGRSLRPRHALPVPPRAADQWRAAPSAGLGDQGRQPQLPCRSDQCGHLRGRADRPAEGHRPHRADDLSERRLSARADRALQPRRAGGRAHAVAGIRQRLCRHLRGARHPPQAPRAGLEPHPGWRRRRALLPRTG